MPAKYIKQPPSAFLVQPSAAAAIPLAAAVTSEESQGIKPRFKLNSMLLKAIAEQRIAGEHLNNFASHGALPTAERRLGGFII